MKTDADTGWGPAKNRINKMDYAVPVFVPAGSVPAKNRRYEGRGGSHGRMDDFSGIVANGPGLKRPALPVYKVFDGSGGIGAGLVKQPPYHFA